jgi:hypothetical protein
MFTHIRCLEEFLTTSKVLDARRRGVRLKRMRNTLQGGAIEGNAAGDALMVDQGGHLTNSPATRSMSLMLSFMASPIFRAFRVSSTSSIL